MSEKRNDLLDEYMEYTLSTGDDNSKKCPTSGKGVSTAEVGSIILFILLVLNGTIPLFCVFLVRLIVVISANTSTSR